MHDLNIHQVTTEIILDLVNYFKFEIQNTFMPKIIEVIYENGVFKPLEKVDLKDKAKLKIAIIKDRKDVVKQYKGIFGKAKVDELKEFEEEAMM